MVGEESAADSAKWYTGGMETEQGSLFDKRSYKGQLPQSYSIPPPTADMTVTATLRAYHAYSASSGYSKYTPDDDFTADIKRLGQFTGVKTLQVLQTVDLQQWIAELKQTMPAKTVSRKVAALNNYFRWLAGEYVLARNPAEPIQTPRVTSPLPTFLYDNECATAGHGQRRSPAPTCWCCCA